MYYIQSKFNTDFLHPEYIDEVISKRYKDTNFAIIKESKRWAVYLLLEINGKTHICGLTTYHTRKLAISKITTGQLKKSIDKEYKTLKIIYDFLNQNKNKSI